MAGEDIAEIARGNAEGNLPLGCSELKRGGKIIDRLRHQPRPVDRIHRTQSVLCGNRLVGEQSLHHCLGIVETAVDRDVVDIGRAHRGHLAALDVAHPTPGVEHEDLDIVAPGDRIDRGAAGVAAGRTDDGQRALLAREEFLEQQPEQLERDILERQRRAMEQFEQPVALVELGQRGHRGVREAAIGLFAQLEQSLGGEAVADEGLHHPRGQLRIAQPAHRGDLGGRKARPAGGQVKAAIARQPRQRHTGEIERRGAASGRDIVHRSRA